jgi:glycosyltransferase involved in cell wall biosynthesis
MTTRPPLVSVITVSLNSARTIGSTIESVNTQSYEHLEHIFIDGASNDGTQRLVAECARRRPRLFSERDGGIYDAMNKGLALASGEVVGFLNADDAFESPEAVAAIASTFEDQDIQACYGDVVYVRADDPTRVVRYWRSGPYARGQCATGWAPPHPTLYVRRDALLRHGGFNDRLRVAADFEMALRLLDVLGLTVRYIPEVLVRMRAGGVSNGSVRGILSGHRDMASALHAHGLPAGWGWSARRLARRIPQFLSRPIRGKP